VRADLDVAPAEAALRVQVARQVAHWRAAVVTLADLDNFAAPAAWRALEHRLGTALRASLTQSVDRLRRESDVLEAELRAAETTGELETLRERVVRFRVRFLQTETALDFYGDAVNTRTTPKLAALLTACDVLVGRGLDAVLGPCGQPTPPVLTYVDYGIGASIVRRGLRLWDGRSLSAAAAIKVTRHNLYRPTSVMHEGGHQAAFTLDWNEELAEALLNGLGDEPAVARTWAGWASELAADAFAFAHTGYAAVAALHDVIAGERAGVFALRPFDPHPVAYLRVLLGVVMCRQFYGAGPWNDLERAWRLSYPLDMAPGAVRGLLLASLPRLSLVAEICLSRPMRAFGRRSLTTLVDPARVRPDALAALAHEAGPALGSSGHWVFGECLRLLALSGYRAATKPERATEIAEQFESWMLRLGRGSETSP